MINLKSALKKVLTTPFKVINFLFRIYCNILSLFDKSLGYLWTEYLNDNRSNSIAKISHHTKYGIIDLKFYTPNALCAFRANTFSSKEPETIEWIDEFGGSGVLFDIGANIGLYSIYFAKTQKSNVYCFEPSVFNLGLLAKNSHLNSVEEYLKIIPSPLSEINGFADFTLSSTAEGGALSAFGVNYGCDGEELKKVLSYQIYGFSLDYLTENNLIKEHPALVKIDVDGIEHILLRGARNTLSDQRCKTVLIEINDHFAGQAKEASDLLKQCGFTLREKRQSSDLKNSSEYNGLFNQIWIK